MQHFRAWDRPQPLAAWAHLMTITDTIFKTFQKCSKSCLPLPDLQILFPCTCTALWEAPVVGMASWALWGSKLTKHSGKASRQWWRNCQKISEWGVPPVFLDNWAATVCTQEDKFKQLQYSKNEYMYTHTHTCTSPTLLYFFPYKCYWPENNKLLTVSYRST